MDNLSLVIAAGIFCDRDTMRDGFGLLRFQEITG
jgi:hypothetical protein